MATNDDAIDLRSQAWPNTESPANARALPNILNRTFQATLRVSRNTQRTGAASVSTSDPHTWRSLALVHSGWLFKKGGSWSTWRKRYFVLRGDIIFYYREQTDLKHLGEIPLAGNEARELPASHEDTKAPSKFLFEILPGEGGQGFAHNRESYLLCASSALEMQEWLSKIVHVIRKQERAMFKQTLSDSVTKEKGMKNGGVAPILLINTCCFLRKYGLKEVGLFRLPGRVYRFKELQEAYDKGLYPRLGTPQDTDVHSVASLLKLYLRSIPDAVIPLEYSQSFIAASKFYQQNSSEGVQVLIGQLKALPDANYNTLKYLCRFLYEVKENAEDNRMDLNNLATVFGPNFVRSGPGDEEKSMKDYAAMVRVMEDTSHMNSLTRVLIAEHKTLFPATSEEHPIFSGEDAGPWSDVPTESISQNLIDLGQDETQAAEIRGDDEEGVLGRVTDRSSGSHLKRRGAPALAHESLVETSALIDLRPPQKSPPGLQSPQNSRPESLVDVASSSEDGTSNSSDEDEGLQREKLHHQVSRQGIGENIGSIATRQHRVIQGPGRDAGGLSALQLRVSQLQREIENEQRAMTHLKRQLAAEVEAKRAYERRYVDERAARIAAEERSTQLEKQLDDLFQQHYSSQT